MKTLVTLLLFVVMTINTPSFSHAGEQNIETLITQKNNEMEALLSKRDPRETIQFLHEQVKEGAVFNIEYRNEFMPENKADSIQLDKKDYINSFIQGTNLIDNYSVEITTQQVAINNNRIIAKEITQEEGTMLDPVTLDNGIPFVSKTTCITEYVIENNQNLKTQNGHCITETGRSNTI
ncbi:MAG: hypothetical protein AAF549_08280 [Pseudomonadota bacterium]